MMLVLALLVSGGGVAIVHSRISSDLNATRARVTQMEADIEQFKPQLAQVAEFRKRKANLQKKIDVIDELDRARSGPVRILDVLSSWNTGRRILIGEVSISEEAVRLGFHERSVWRRLNPWHH